MRRIVIIPTYNERENLQQLVTGIFLHGGDCDILIVDDGSPDGTGDLADNLAREHAGRLFVIHREEKRGLGPAYLAGFAFALGRGYELIQQMDGDPSHDSAYLADFEERCLTCDLVLGSRYMHGIAVVNWDLKRLLLSKLAGNYARLVLGIPFTDPTSGFKCWRDTALRSLDFQQALANGCLFQIGNDL